MCIRDSPDAEPLLLPDFPQCIANLKNGECAAVMIDEISAEQYMQLSLIHI